MRFVRAAALLLAAAPLTGCVAINATANIQSCPGNEASRQVAELVFGRNIGQSLGVSEADFTRFLDEEVSPRFPDGLTVSDSQGRWLYKGETFKEPGKRLTLILTGPDDRRKIGEIAAAYERRFHQDAVLTMVHGACVAFWLSKK
jgi:hypothetical protein